MTFETNFVRICDLLGGQNVFVTPPFQRPYSWSHEMAATLCDDLQNAAIRLARGQQAHFGGLDQYFLGTLIVSRSSQAAPYSVIDGQQRLVTLTAILAVLRDRVAVDDLRDELHAYIVRPARLALGVPERPRMTIRSIDQDNYAAWVATIGGTRNLPKTADTDTSILLLNALKAINAAIEPTQDAYYRDFAEFLLQQSSVVLIEARSIEAAFRLFQTVNKRGQPISALDVARTEYIGATADQGPEGAELADAWDAVEEQLSREAFETYVQTIAARTVPDGQAKNLLEMLHDISKSPQYAIEFRSNLKGFLTSYRALEDSNLDFGSDSSLVNAALRSLLNWKNAHWKNLALDWLIKKPSARDTITFFKALDALCAHFAITGSRAPTQRKRFQAISKHLDTPEVLKSAQSPLFLSDTEISNTLSKLNEPIMPPRAFIKPLLARLNTMMGAAPFESAVLDSLTIEHVLPQNPKTRSRWTAAFPDDSNRNKLTYMLGNHALLTRLANPLGSNKDFEEKREIYFSFEGYQSFPITNQIQSYDQWDEEAICHRTEKLLKLARDAFKGL